MTPVRSSSLSGLPAHRLAEARAADRTTVMRRLRPSETVIFADHLKRLDSETRRLRFGNAVNDGFLESYAGLALSSDALVTGCWVDGILRGVAELRFLDGERRDAEGAFCLEAPFQGQGLGDKLFERLIHAARNRRVRRLFLTCLRENRRMQRIADHYGAELSFSGGDVTAELRRPYADATSLAAEWLDEGQAFVFAMLDWRRRGFRRTGRRSPGALHDADAPAVIPSERP